MRNSVAITPIIIGVASIAAFIAAITAFDFTLTNNDPAVALFFLGTCLFGAAGMFTEPDERTAFILPALIGAFGVVSIAVGIAASVLGAVWGFVILAFGTTAVLGFGIFCLAANHR